MGYGRLASVIAIATAGITASGLVTAGPVSATTSTPHATPAALSFRLRTLDNPHDPNYNILTGINKSGDIVGYYGSSLPGHPAKGYLLKPPYSPSDYVKENYPGSAQTQVFSINDKGVIVGTFSYTNKASRNAWYGFWTYKGKFHKVSHPTNSNSSPPINELAGVNNSGFTVGTYVNSAGQYRPYRYNIYTHQFSVPVAGAASATASGINNKGAVVGFFRKTTGPWVSYVTQNGNLAKFTVRGAGRTEAWKINDHGVVVGVYTKSNKVYAFTWTASGGYHGYYYVGGKGIGMVGINDSGKIVGWYQDSSGNYHGFLAIP